MDVTSPSSKGVRFEIIEKAQESTPAPSLGSSSSSSSQTFVSVNAEVEFLRQRVKFLEDKDEETTHLLSELNRQKAEYDLLRSQSSKGFKILRSNADAARSTKSLAITSSKGVALTSSKSTSALPDPSAFKDYDKDEQIKSLHADLEELQKQLRSCTVGPGAPTEVLVEKDNQIAKLTKELAAAVADLDSVMQRLTELEAHNAELLQTQEQFNLLRAQSSPGFKMIRDKSTKLKSMKLAAASGKAPRPVADDENINDGQDVLT